MESAHRSDRSVGEELFDWSAAETARAIRDGLVSVRDTVDAYISRNLALHEDLNGLVIPLFDEARARALELDEMLAKGESVGALHGVPITIKEQYDVAGTDNTLGLPQNVGHIAAEDSPLVARLRGAGAVILGKSNVMMTLSGWESDNPVYGRTNNPWNLLRTPGGSSGGESALVSARASALGLAGDLGGSIRIPSAFTGCYGLKPTAGRLTNVGTPPAYFCSGVESIVAQPGPIARSVGDLCLAMEIMTSGDFGALPDLPPPVTWNTELPQIAGMKVGLIEDNGVVRPSPAISRALRECAAMLEQHGAIVETFAFPEPDPSWRLFLRIMAGCNGQSLPRTLGSEKPSPLLRDFARGLSMPNAMRRLVSWIMDLRGEAQLAELIRALSPLSAEQYVLAIEERNRFRHALLTKLRTEGYSAILSPCYPTVAPQHGGTAELLAIGGSYCMLHNVMGTPAGVVPVTLVREGEEQLGDRGKEQAERGARLVEAGSVGLPVCVQVASYHWQERTVLAVMAALEESLVGREDYPLGQLPAAIR